MWLINAKQSIFIDILFIEFTEVQLTVVKRNGKQKSLWKKETEFKVSLPQASIPSTLNFLEIVSYLSGFVHCMLMVSHLITV